MALFKKLLLMTTGGVLLVAILALVGIWRAGDRFFAAADLLFGPPPTEEPQVDIRALVVRKIRGASELTTAVFTMEAVVPSSRDRVLGRFVIGKTTLLYIAYGEVRAGIDLEKISDKDITYKNDTLYVRLPPPRILDSKIDVHRSSAYDYDRGFLGLGPDVAPELQDLSQEKALEKIVAAACSEDILQTANNRAKLVVEQLVNHAGYETVAVETQPPAADACTTALPTTTAPTPPPQPSTAPTSPTPAEAETSSSPEAQVAPTTAPTTAPTVQN